MTPFTKIYNMQDGSLGRKHGVHLGKDISYIEPCRIRDKTKEDSKEIHCTKVYFGSSFIIIEMTMLDFIKNISPRIEFI